MSQLKYLPVNTSCVNKATGSANQKGNRKVLAFMNTGQGRYGDGDFEEIPSCVFPKETHTTMSLDNCMMRTSDTNTIVNADFTNTTSGKLDIDRTNAAKQIQRGEGVYPIGCSISTTDGNKFSNAINKSRQMLEYNNEKELKCLQANIDALNAEIADLRDVQIPNQQTTLDKANADYDATLADCNYHIWWKQWALDTGIPKLKSQIEEARKQFDWTHNDYWNQVNNLGKWWADKCNGNSYGLWRNDSRGPGNWEYCMDVYQYRTDEASPIVGWTCHGGPNQRWNIIDNEILQSQHSGMCLDVLYAGTDAGTPLIQYPCHGGANQRFFSTIGPDGGRDLRPRHAPNMCVDPSGYGADGEQLVLWPCDADGENRYQDQRWDYKPYGNYKFEMRNL